MPYFVGQGASAVVDHMRKLHQPPRGSGISEIGAAARREYRADPERRNRPALAKLVAPTTYQLTNNRKTLPDLINGPQDCNMIVSDKVRAAIEDVEPSRHYFFPLNILRRNGGPWPTPYWGFTAGPAALVQALIVEQSATLDWVPMTTPYASFTRRIYCIDEFGDHRPVLNISSREAWGFVADEEAFHDRHVVIEQALQDSHVFFFSDELVANLKSRKVRGFEFVAIKTEPRLVPPYGKMSTSGAVE